jgi:hypothetical protein
VIAPIAIAIYTRASDLCVPSPTKTPTVLSTPIIVASERLSRRTASLVGV